MAKEAPPRVPGYRLLPALSDPDAQGQRAAIAKAREKFTPANREEIAEFKPVDLGSVTTPDHPVARTPAARPASHRHSQRAPTRVPAARLSRIDTSEKSEIYKALKAGGCTRSPDDLSIICDLTNKIEWALRFYVSDKSFAMEPAKFRSELREFAKRLSAFAEGYPPDGSVLGRALKEALSRDEEKYRSAASEISAETDFDPERLVDRVRGGVKVLHVAVRELERQEGGRGRDSDRAADQLMKQLCSIWREYTGREPGRGGRDPYKDGCDRQTPFERFADGIFDALPSEFQPRTRYRTRKLNHKSPKPS
jgi:hypothetical protein